MKRLNKAVRMGAPEVPFLVISGTPDPDVETDPVTNQAQAFLRKPILMEPFANSVHDLLT